MSCQIHPFFYHSSFCEAEGPWSTCGNKEGGGGGTLKNESCYLARFMQVILLGLLLVSTNLKILQFRCIVTELQYRSIALQLIQLPSYPLHYAIFRRKRGVFSKDKGARTTICASGNCVLCQYICT